MHQLLSFYKYLKSGRKYFIIAVIAGILFGATSGLAIPVIFEKVFRRFFELPSNAQAPIWQVIAIAGVLPLLFFVRGAMSLTNAYFMSAASMLLMKALRRDIFIKIQNLPMSFFDKHSHGDLIARMANDPGGVQGILLEVTAEAFKQPSQMLAAIGTLIYLSLQNADFTCLLIFVFAVGIAILPVRMVRKQVKQKAMQLQNSAGVIFNNICENLDAVTEVRSFNLEEDQIARHDTQLDLARKFTLLLVKYQGLQQPVMELLSVIVVSIMFVYAYFIKMPFSVFSAMGIALYFALDPVKKIANMLGKLHQAEPAMERVRYILDMPLEIQDPVNPVPVDRLQGNIVFKDVGFSYNEGSPVLKGVNAAIPAGVTCALVGASGAGKSTSAKLISRFYESTAGQVLIDGIDIKYMRLKDLRRNIAIVSQFPVLFNDTIYNNILIGNPNATQEEVYKAAQDAYAHEFILSLSQGYNTLVGDRGDLLSGGQKQRIALARAFLKNAPILVLDEATSALDAQSEYYIQQALGKLTQNKTVIVIAHRLSTIKNADMILVFDKGEIAASGTHAELMKSCRIYQDYVNKQSAPGTFIDAEQDPIQALI